MRTIGLFTLMISLCCMAQKSNSDFVFTINLPNSNSLLYGLHTDIGNYTYNFDVDWDNDGTFDNTYTNSSINRPNSSVNHLFSATGIHTIRIRGTYPKLFFRNDTKLISIDQWGDIVWQEVFDGFRDCINLTTCPLDTPDFSQITSLGNMFYGATNFNGPVNHWDVSNVQYLTYTFGFATSFNQPMNDWDVSNVTHMLAIFTNATSFNQDLSNWNTSSLSFSPATFYKAHSFNQDISTWDMSNVTDAAQFLEFAYQFNQDLSSWSLDTMSGSGLVKAFDSTSISTTNYDNILASWSQKNLHNLGVIGVKGLEYCDTIARNAMIAKNVYLFGDNQSLNCLAVGIDEIPKNSSIFEVYPNPTKGIIRIAISSAMDVEIFDHSGKRIKHIHLTEGENSIDLSNYNSGLFILRANGFSKKVFKL